MRRPIVVGVDGSPGAQQALRWPVEEGRRRGLPVVAPMAWSYLDQHATPDDHGFDPTYGENDARVALDAFVLEAMAMFPSSGGRSCATCRFARSPT